MAFIQKHTNTIKCSLYLYVCIFTHVVHLSYSMACVHVSLLSLLLRTHNALSLSLFPLFHRSLVLCTTLLGCSIYICVYVVLLMLPEWRRISIKIVEDKCLWGKKFCINFIMTIENLSIHKNVEIWIV